MTKAKEKENRIKKERNNLVVQSNTLIRNLKAIKDDLTVSEQKLIVYMISKICADDKDFKTVSLNLSEYCQICGIKKSGREYERIKQSIKNLRNKSWWIKNNNEEILFAWIDTAKIKRYKTIELTISEPLKPYLLELTENFTKYELINVLCLRSKYSIRLYEIFKSYLWLGIWEISIEEFRELLNIQNKYSSFRELNRSVIIPTLKEINKFTDLQINVSTQKNGNKVDKLIFNIKETDYQMIFDTFLNQDKRLDGKK